MKILFRPVTRWLGEVYTYGTQALPLLVQSYHRGNIWDTRAHRIPRARFSISIAGMRWYSNYQRTVCRRRMAVAAMILLDLICFINSTNQRLSIIVIGFNDSRSKINHQFYRRNVAYNYVSQTRIQSEAKSEFAVLYTGGGGAICALKPHNCGSKHKRGGGELEPRSPPP